MTSNAGYPLVEEIHPSISPLAAFEVLKNDFYPYFLDSGMDPQKLGRYSFIGSDPFSILKTQGNSITQALSETRQPDTGNPFQAIKSNLDNYQMDTANLPFPFAGGAVGYLSYDLGRSIESIPQIALDDLKLPGMILGFYDCGLVFDNRENRAYIVSTGFPLLEEPGRQKRAYRRLLFLRNRLQTAVSTPEYQGGNQVGDSNFSSKVTGNFTRKQYLAAVNRARQYIIDGDMFEVNLSQRFETDIRMSPYELYRRLRSVNPAPFAGYLGFDDAQIVCASPERFLRKNGDTVETRPIKGTRRRGKTPEEDKVLADELLSSSKDRAENIMIVDLERNDLGRICRYGSVKVSELTVLEKFPTVFHLTSTIEGRLQKSRNIADILTATFPGGSITGAPKVRAMEIIEELEPTRRSIYTGSMGYIGFNGNIDLNIVIRTFIVKNKKVYFQAGGAVVYDSDPEAEYQETMDKAKALFDALRQPVL
jgi:para-aminobenzoate synthetase component I